MGLRSPHFVLTEHTLVVMLGGSCLCNSFELLGADNVPRPQYFNTAGLPQRERSQLENIHFLCCSNVVGALELAAGLVTDLKILEEGIVMYDACLGQMFLW